MQFASDNWAGAAPEVMEAIAREAARSGAAYGGSEIDARSKRVSPKSSSARSRSSSWRRAPPRTGSPWRPSTDPAASIFCHRDAHMIEGECGGVEYLTGGARLFGLEGDDGRIDVEALKRAIAALTPASEHHGQGMAVSITQQTEAGTAYSLDQIREIAAIAKASGLPLHMDGARFANALVRSNATPAEMTWKAGVDILSFGATKNGCVAAEAIVFFDPSVPATCRSSASAPGSSSRSRASSRRSSTPICSDGLWLRLARHANDMADRLRAGIARASHAREAWPTSGNEIFVAVPDPGCERLAAEGAIFHEWTRTIGVALQQAKRSSASSRRSRRATDEVDLFLKKLG